MQESYRSTTTTLLFTDIVGSTRLIQQLGQIDAYAALASHRTELQRAVELTRGHELQWLGDGAMVAFSSAAAAVRCATVLQKRCLRTRDPSIRIRIGINVGDTLHDACGEHQFGLPVIVARRVCDRAAAGQILCTSAVEIILIGRPEFRFRPAGTACIKGLDASVPLCEVLWQPEQLAERHTEAQRSGHQAPHVEVSKPRPPVN